MNNSNTLKISEAIIIITITCLFSAFAGFSVAKVKYMGEENFTQNNNSEKDEAIANFIKQYNYIKDNYYDGSKIDDKDMMKVALESVLEHLGIDDSYSTYMDSEKYNQFNLNLNGSYEGLGISIYKDEETGKIYVVDIMKGSPAESKMKIGDIILSIDDKLSKDMTTQDFSNYVVNGNKEVFKIKIERDSKEQVIELKKGNVELESVYSEIIKKGNKKIGYISMSIFAANSSEQFKRELEKLENDNIDSLIIDLRSNTGGHLSEVSKIISLFLNKDKVIYQLEKNGKKTKYYSEGNINKTYPIIFIGNGATASASEVFIISLKDNLNAKLVGTKTYGKGTVQEMINMENGDQYKFTTKKWLSPKGTWVNDTEGIVPDVEIELSDKYFDKPTKENDNQLQRAILELTKTK